MTRVALLAVLIVAGACTAPVPPSPGSTATVAPTPSTTNVPLPTATPIDLPTTPTTTPSAEPKPSATPIVVTLTIDRIWQVSCADVAENVCRPIAHRYLNLLAGSYASVLKASAGQMSVEPRVVCPDGLSGDVDGSLCWQAETAATNGETCMVFARYVGTDPRYPDYIRVGGATPGILLPSQLPPCT